MSTDTGPGDGRGASRPPRGRPDRVRFGRQLRVWRSFLRSHAEMMRRLERDLVNAHGLPLAWYDVLVQLAEAPERRLRMTDLADRVLLSRSGLTRLVDRLTATGLVSRQSDPSDARGTFTVLTDEGLGRLREAAPTHLRGIGEYMSHLSADELEQLGGLLAKLLDGPDPPDPTGPAGTPWDAAPNVPSLPAAGHGADGHRAGVDGGDRAGVGVDGGDPVGGRSGPTITAASTPATDRRP